jgi:thioredoxin reductase
MLGQNLVDLCAEQGLQYGADVKLGEEAQTLERIAQNGEELLALTTAQGNRYLSRALIVTAGHGAFEPRRLAVGNVDEWLGRGLHYVVREKAQFKDKRCVIVGGGDSALDWTLGLQDTARLPIVLVHRRYKFRALETSVNEARRLEQEGAVRILTPHEVRDVHGDGRIKAVTIEKTDDATFEQNARPRRASLRPLRKAHKPSSEAGRAQPSAGLRRAHPQIEPANAGRSGRVAQDVPAQVDALSWAGAGSRPASFRSRIA